MQLLSRIAGEATGYPHLTRYERDQIAELKAQGLGPTAIGKSIGRDKSTIHCPAGYCEAMSREGAESSAAMPIRMGPTARPLLMGATCSDVNALQSLSGMSH